MKKYALACSILATLSGCSALSYPQDVDALKQMSDSSPLVTSKQYRIERPLSEIGQALEHLAQKCLNTTTVATTQYRHSLTGGGVVAFRTRYETSVESKDGGIELAMRLIPIKGGINEPKEGGIVFAALAKPAENASDITHYFGRFNGDDFSDVVAKWAAGEGRGCPEMPR